MEIGDMADMTVRELRQYVRAAHSEDGDGLMWYKLGEVGGGDDCYVAIAFGDDAYFLEQIINDAYAGGLLEDVLYEYEPEPDDA